MGVGPSQLVSKAMLDQVVQERDAAMGQLAAVQVERDRVESILAVYRKQVEKDIAELEIQLALAEKVAELSTWADLKEVGALDGISDDVFEEWLTANGWARQVPGHKWTHEKTEIWIQYDLEDDTYPSSRSHALMLYGEHAFGLAAAHARMPLYRLVLELRRMR